MSERKVQDSMGWRVLRRALPAWYRQAYSSELLRLHVEQARRAGGLRFWLRLTADVLLTSAQVRVDGLRGSPQERPARAHSIAALAQDVRLTVRGLLHSPGFTWAVLVTLALGLGANLTLFQVLDRLLLSAPEHIEEPEQVRRITVFGPSMFSTEPAYSSALSFPDYRDLSDVRSFAAVAGFSARTLTLGRTEASQRVSVELASPSYFALLGVRPFHGRFYTEAEDRTDASLPPAVLSYGFWQRQYGGERAVLGSTLELGRGRYTVVGVAPRGFTGINVAPIDVWLPLQAANTAESGSTDWTDARSWYWLAAVVRMNAQISVEAAQAEATARYRAARSAFERKPSNSIVVLPPVIAARGPQATSESKVARALAVVAALMLVIACANAANLFLVRGVQRRKLLAVQSALGVGRVRLLIQLVTESLLLALAAGAVAYLLSRAAGPLLFRTLLPDAALPTNAGLRVLALTGLLALVTTLLAGMVPALRASRVDLMEIMRARREQPRSSWTRRLLLSVQAALSMILLVAAGLFVKSLNQARSVDLGLDLNTVVIELELSNGTRYGGQLAQAVYPALERIRAHPAVASATATSLAPFSGVWGYSVDLPGADSIVLGPTGPFTYAAAGDYFRTAGIPILHGRALTDEDDLAGAPRVAVVNETMARALWGSLEVTGQCLIVVARTGEQHCTTVVGVAANVLPFITATSAHQIYYLPPRHPDTGSQNAQVLLVRTKQDAAQVLPALRDIVRTAAPDVRYVDAATLRDRMAPQLRSWQLGTTLLSAFGLLALLVAAAGLYSVLAFDVAQRRFELGVRAALGAQPPRLVRAIVLDTLLVSAVGVLAGTAAALALARAAQSLLFKVTPSDPLVYGAALAALLLIAAGASALPAWRAMRVDPRIALQSD